MSVTGEPGHVEQVRVLRVVAGRRRVLQRELVEGVRGQERGQRQRERSEDRVDAHRTRAAAAAAASPSQSRAPVTTMTPIRNGAPPPGASTAHDDAGAGEGEVQQAGRGGRPATAPAGPDQREQCPQPEREQDQALAGRLVEAVVRLDAGDAACG